MDDIIFIIQSLGMTASKNSRIAEYSHNGEARKGKKPWRSYICHRNDINLFYTERKRSRFQKKKRDMPRRYIDKIEYIGEKEMKCISVDSESNLYLTEDFIVTHNTISALCAGLDQVLQKDTYEKLVLVRPVEPVGRDLGFLPGTMEEKIHPWLKPFKDSLEHILGDRTQLEMFMDRGKIEIEPLSYIRGRSISDSFLMVDECQNLSPHEIKTVMTRVGDNSKIVLNGDIYQIDNAYVDEISNGLTHAVEKFKDSPIAGHCTLKKGERSRIASIAAEAL